MRTTLWDACRRVRAKIDEGDASGCGSKWPLHTATAEQWWWLTKTWWRPPDRRGIEHTCPCSRRCLLQSHIVIVYYAIKTAHRRSERKEKGKKYTKVLCCSPASPQSSTSGKQQFTVADIWNKMQSPSFIWWSPVYLCLWNYIGEALFQTMQTTVESFDNCTKNGQPLLQAAIYTQWTIKNVTFYFWL